ncbi:MAG: 1,4-alpha-glucan branching enzyme, partial [Bacteroidetes bacterium]|nr:1,4-alpha-glucan branching enzyme [Bacteroidota bacterium]
MGNKELKKPALKKENKISPDIIYTSLWTDYDVNLFKAGYHYQLYNKFGAHIIKVDGVQGTCLSVWAPNAKYVSVIGNFNGWNRWTHAMHARWDASGIWEVFIPELQQGEYYKYFIEDNKGYTVEKGDPYAIHWETPPATASVIWERDFKWTDKKWMEDRSKNTWLGKPLSIYELHIGSWRRKDNGAYLTYIDLAEELPAYLNYMGFTHVELMPVM